MGWILSVELEIQKKRTFLRGRECGESGEEHDLQKQFNQRIPEYIDR